VEVFPGNYEDYLWRKEGKPAAFDGEPSPASPNPVTAAATNHREPEAQAAAEPKIKRLNPIKLKQMRERLLEVEEEIARLEAAITTAEIALQNFVSVEETQRQTDLLERSREELQQRMSEWEEMSTVLES
jgi:ATP-binding cassette subfamily F protein 3